MYIFERIGWLIVLQLLKSVWWCVIFFSHFKQYEYKFVWFRCDWEPWKSIVYHMTNEFHKPFEFMNGWHITTVFISFVSSSSVISAFQVIIHYINVDGEKFQSRKLKIQTTLLCSFRFVETMKLSHIHNIQCVAKNIDIYFGHGWADCGIMCKSLIQKYALHDILFCTLNISYTIPKYFRLIRSSMYFRNVHMHTSHGYWFSKSRFLPVVL